MSSEYFKYKGNDITNNFDDTYPGTQTTGFKINGVDIGTTYTPAYTGFTSTSTTNYKNNGSDIKSLFSSSKPVPTITITEGTDSNSHSSVQNFDKTVKHLYQSHGFDHHYIFYQDGQGRSEVGYGGQLYSEYNINVSNIADCSATILLCGGGGGGGNYSGYAGPGGGGAGEVKVGTINLEKDSNYTLRVGLGGLAGTGNGKGSNTIFWGPGIDGDENVGIQAHGGGYGGSPNTGSGDGGSGGSGGGSSNGGYAGQSVPGYPDVNMTWYNEFTSYGHSGGNGPYNRGGGGGGGAGSAGTDGHPSNGYPGNGGDPITLYGEEMAGGGGGRGDGGRVFHGTSYQNLYGSGGRAAEAPGKGGLAMLMFNNDQAVSIHNSYDDDIF